MQKTFSTATLPLLSDIAEGLLRLGCDRAADAIYAAIEETEAQHERGEWAEAFGG